MRNFCIYSFLIISFLAGNALAQGEASNLFSNLRHLVFQIRLIDLASGEKSSLGSGFQISEDGYIATNFHVVSSYVHEPDKFKIEYVALDGVSGSLELRGIDVVHDLAILSIDKPVKGAFKFNPRKLKKGARLYSMGNPLDLGMTIIEGNYNGLLKVSRYQKILFSGSLNAGMSGGPAMDESGHIIGVNVAKGGEQISFLVPVKELIVLLGRVMNGNVSEDFEKDITESLYEDQQKYYGNIINDEWVISDFQKLQLAKNITPSLKCWGHTQDKKKLLYNAVHQHCQSQDQIYINDNFYTGGLYYDYEWTSTEQLNSFQFYSVMEERFKHISLANASDKEDITNYSCDSKFIEIDMSSWKISTCIRAYKKYSGLYDFTVLMASVDRSTEGAIVKIGGSGISKDNIKRLIDKFVKSVKWKN